MLRTYKEAIKYLNGLIPLYEEYKFPAELGLRRMKCFMSLLGNPQDKYTSIHIAGTSGKGSTSYLISKILQEAGYKTGLHLSPHLISERERMQVNGKMISEGDFMSLVNKAIRVSAIVAKSEFGKITYYEFLLALTFLYFAKEKVNIAVVETGLGGTYDGTNVLKSKIAVVTSIGFDHIHILGKTLAKIAGNKAGIIKNGQRAVISALQKKEAEKVLIEKATKEKVPFFEEGKDFFVKIKEINDKGVTFNYESKHNMFDNIYCSLLGIHQAYNTSVAIRAVEELENAGFDVSKIAIRKALDNAFFSGRLEVRRIKGKTVILDGAHNEDKMKALIKSLKIIWPNKRIIGIVAFKQTKDIASMSKILVESIDEFIITRFSSSTDTGKDSSMDQEKIAREIRKSGFNKPVYLTQAVEEAINKALKESKRDELILITGSLYLVGEALKVLKSNLNPQVSS